MINEKDYNGYTKTQRLAIIEQCEEITETEQEDIYRDAVSETEGTITICGMEYEAGRIMEEVDPTAFRCGMRDYFGTEDYIEVYEKDEAGNTNGGLYRKDEADEAADGVDESTEQA